MWHTYFVVFVMFSEGDVYAASVFNIASCVGTFNVSFAFMIVSFPAGGVPSDVKATVRVFDKGGDDSLGWEIRRGLIKSELKWIEDPSKVARHFRICGK